VGGTVHLVINNQLGFTTAPESARSSVYPTDVAKTVQAPIFHVNGDDPEACVRVARLAFAFRQQFAKDVVIDMVCYRRHGHNEGDDPSYTQPLMYRRIDQRRSVRKLYTEVLVRRGDITVAEAEKALDDFSARMATAFHETRHSSPPQIAPEGPTGTDVEPYRSIATGVPGPVLDRVVDALHSHPGGFTVHPKLARQIDARRALYEGGEVDWPLAEALALGSLLGEGIDIRLAGQDSRRGTFSQRHAVLVDYMTGEEWTPLGHVKEEGASPAGRFWIYDSMLSEYAALGFEYGWSVAHGEALVAWEAQFGDFVNGAQIIVDQFIVAAEDKWRQRSGLVLLLPHGQEGQGPEHSSARLERFLSLCAAGNIAVAQPTDAAQYFHLLRAQALRRPRRPLVIFTAKSLLRARNARSRVETLCSGSFAEVVDDPAWTGDGAGDATLVRRVALASGKVAYDAMVRRDSAGAPLAVVRLEQLHPWPEQRLLEVLAGYPNAEEVYWLQEEPENMGAWTYVHERLHAALRDRTPLRHVSRPPSASPSPGSLTVHLQEQELLVDRVLEGL